MALTKHRWCLLGANFEEQPIGKDSVGGDDDKSHVGSEIRPSLPTQHAAIRFLARPIGDARYPASAPQSTYLAGKPSNVCFAELRAGRVFLRGHSGSEGRSLRLVPSLRSHARPASALRAVPTPPSSAACLAGLETLPSQTEAAGV